MSKGRLEAFSDGVLAIVITIMVLELRPPDGTTLDDLYALWPKVLSYALSFAYLAIYWVNHHHLFHAAHGVSARVLWSNMLLLFTLSLVPFGTAWVGEHSFAGTPVLVYNVILLLPALAYFLLVRALIAVPGQPPALAAEIGRDTKGKISILIYLIALALSVAAPAVAIGLDMFVAALWIVPDPRMERVFRQS
jgi:uncharacterized membrane protein